MKSGKIPGIAECYEIMENRMLPHIKEHSEQVMKVALAIANNLKPGVIVDKNLVAASSLLHDITKTESLTTHEPHDITGGAFIDKLGYAEVAEIIKEHVELKKYNIHDNLSEKEIVFYADKRVMHNKIVSVDERISDLLARYGKTEETKLLILKNKNVILDIEKKISHHLTGDLDQILEHLTVN